MQNLETLIRLARENNENAMLEILNKFQPLIIKYFKKSHFNEDIRSELELKLIEVVKFELNFDILRSSDEGSLVNYIVSSLYHKYLAICAKNGKKAKSELICEDDNLINSNINLYEESIEQMLLFDTMRSVLTEREFYCVYYIVFMGYTAEELSKFLKITKQACNQCKLRAFDKLRKYYENIK